MDNKTLEKCRQTLSLISALILQTVGSVSQKDRRKILDLLDNFLKLVKQECETILGENSSPAMDKLIQQINQHFEGKKL